MPGTTVVDELGVKKRKERTHESFIVVRPPPAKTNHPLNLQVQLVPPSGKDPARPLDSGSTQDLGGSLSRTSSNRSDTSMYSTYSSSGSISTVASSSSSTGRRMIIPLYNLQAHNVMQNVIVDAGTDAKVAKFLKRGLEVIGLAVLEPVEVWGSAAAEAWSVRPPHDGAKRNSLDFSGAGLLSPDLAHTPTSSALSLTSEDGYQTLVVPSSAPDRATPKRLFGRLFKKKDGSSMLPKPPPSPVTSISSIPAAPLSKRSSMHVQPGSLAAGEPSGAILQPPVLGIQPLLSSATIPPRGRPTRYVWVVRRWLKGTQESLLDGVKDMLQQDNTRPGNGLEGLVEVRFEWSRGKSGKSGRGRRRTEDSEVSPELRERGERIGALSKRNSIGRSSTPSTASLQHQPPSHPSPPLSRTSPLQSAPQSPSRTQSPRTKRTALSPAGGRRSLDSHRSVSPHPPASLLTNNTSTEDDTHGDNADESDPEDSETPWTCTLVVRRLAPMRGVELGVASAQPPSIRLKVAALVPTPHHPKVIALLKVPFPLPDIEVEHVRLRKRIVTPAGVARPAPVPEPVANGKSGGSGSGLGKGFWAQQPQREGMMLTAEEIKDVVSSTGLWLVVREAFGGVGRVSRKGDGWRLRG
ncbi:hypothetical protein BKA93DRAFT_736415 [Sparassis latifolia]